MVGPINPVAPMPPAVAPKNKVAGGFGELLSRAFQDLNGTLQAADRAQTAALTGDGTLEEAMIATEKADLALDLAVEMRNRALQAYQQIMTMPV